MSDYIRRFNAALAELDRAGLLQGTSEASSPAQSSPAQSSPDRDGEGGGGADGDGEGGGQIPRIARYGIEIRPMPYASPLQIMLTLGLGFAIFFGLVMWMALWSSRGLSGGLALLITGAAGLIFGSIMIVNYRRMRHKHGLSDWKDL